MYTYLRFSQIYNTIFSHIFAEKFGLGQNVEALTSAILSRYEDLSRFTHVLEIFGHKKSFFGGSKTMFLGKKCMHYIMVYIVYHTELNF